MANVGIGLASSDTSVGCVVYIGGYGRSGSTVLDALLGAAPGNFGLGEVAVLFDIAAGRSGRTERCTCSRRLDDCPVWGEVLARVRRHWTYGDLAAAADLTRRQDTSRVRFSSTASAAMQAYGELWSLVLTTVRETTGAKVLIDSSKTAARRSSTRPLRIAQTTPFRVVMIHLIRDPAAVAWSVMKGSNRRLETGDQNPRLILPLTRSLIGRYRANRHARKAIQHIKGLRLSYEDLCADPATAVATVSAFIGSDPKPILDRIQNGGQFEPDHGISGNRLRRQGFTQLVLDDEWRSMLPTPARFAAHLFRIVDARTLP